MLNYTDVVKKCMGAIVKRRKAMPLSLSTSNARVRTHLVYAQTPHVLIAATGIHEASDEGRRTLVPPVECTCM